MISQKLAAMDDDALHALKKSGSWSEEEIKEWKNARGILK